MKIKAIKSTVQPAEPISYGEWLKYIKQANAGQTNKPL